MKPETTEPSTNGLQGFTNQSLAAYAYENDIITKEEFREFLQKGSWAHLSK
jgi:hypothetical protein